MKNSKTYFLIRIGWLIVLLISSCIIFQVFFYPGLLKKEGWLKEIGDRAYAKKPDILYFSASPNATFAPYDTDQRSISQMLQDTLRNLSVAAIDTGAIHSAVFLHALEQMPSDYRPKAIVMDYTLRSFGPQWIHSPIENSIQRNLNYWNNNWGLLNRLNAALRNYNYISQGERNAIIKYQEVFKKLPFKGACRTINSWRDSVIRLNSGDAAMGEPIRHFGFQIESDNSMLKNYRKIEKWCSDQKIPLILVILPENIESMKEAAGQNLITLCEKNAHILEKIGHPQYCQVLNLMSGLNQSHFFERFNTEHYNSSGRQFVASQIAERIKQMKLEN